jgi:hypothetical protein
LIDPDSWLQPLIFVPRCKTLISSSILFSGLPLFKPEEVGELKQSLTGVRVLDLSNNQGPML